FAFKLITEARAARGRVGQIPKNDIIWKRSIKPGGLVLRRNHALRILLLMACVDGHHGGLGQKWIEPFR
ncbi:hypothetical protein J6590_105252, partial [Homalodisca vitripennis]